MAAKKNYQALSEELEQVLNTLQQTDLDIDTAAKMYEKGVLLVKELEKALQDSENKVTKIKANLSKPLK